MKCRNSSSSLTVWNPHWSHWGSQFQNQPLSEHYSILEPIERPTAAHHKIIQHSVQCWLELSTNLHEVSQCSEKAHTKTFPLLNRRLNTVSRGEIGMLDVRKDHEWQAAWRIFASQAKSWESVVAHKTRKRLVPCIPARICCCQCRGGGWTSERPRLCPRHRGLPRSEPRPGVWSRGPRCPIQRLHTSYSP